MNKKARVFVVLHKKSVWELEHLQFQSSSALHKLEELDGKLRTSIEELQLLNGSSKDVTTGVAIMPEQLEMQARYAQQLAERVSECRRSFEDQRRIYERLQEKLTAASRRESFLSSKVDDMAALARREALDKQDRELEDIFVMTKA